MQTLEKLKEENAAAEAEATETTPVVEEAETEEDEALEEAQEEGETGESDSDDSEEPDVDSWMQPDDEASESDNETVPLASHLKMRSKLKEKNHGLEERSNALENEVKALKAKLDSIGGVSKSETGGQAQAMPSPDDFEDDYDGSKYQQAMSGWMQDQVAKQVAAVTKTANQEQQSTRQAEALKKAVDSHYERAAEFASKANISPEVYQSADLMMRQTIEGVLPDMGDAVTDELISRLGEGSEKVVFYLFKNTAARDKFKSALVQDPSGLSAGMYLGELKKEVTPPSKRVSTAPRPATTASGDGTGLTQSEKALIKAYKSAEKRGDAQGMYDTKQKARASGIDTKHW